MEYKEILTAFGLVFLAELGDKTQLATVCLAADCKSSVAIFIGSATALVLCSLIGALGGEALSRFIRPEMIKIIAGVFFIGAGIWILMTARS